MAREYFSHETELQEVHEIVGAVLEWFKDGLDHDADQWVVTDLSRALEVIGNVLSDERNLND